MIYPIVSFPVTSSDP